MADNDMFDKTETIDGNGLMDRLFQEPVGDIIMEPQAPVVVHHEAPQPVAPTPIPVAQPVVVAPKPAEDALQGVPPALLGIKPVEVKPAAPVAPVEDHVAKDAEFDRQTEITASRFNNAEQKRAFYAVRNEAKEHRSEARAAKQKAAELQAKLQELEGHTKKLADTVTTPLKQDPELLTKVADLEKQVGAYENTLGRLDLQQSDGFQRQFDIPLKSMENRVKKLLTGPNRDAEAAGALMQQVLQAPDRDAQLGLLQEEPVAVQGAIINVLADMSEVNENRKIALENWKLSKAAVQQEQERASQIQFLKNVYQDADNAVQTLTGEGNFLLAEVPDNAEWNSAVKQRIDAAKGILQNSDAKTIVKYVVEGITAADTRMLYVKLAQAYMTLKNEASTLVSHTPALGGSGTVQPVVKVEKPKDGKAVLDGIFGAD